jgi:hypothetical protein
MFSSSGGIGVNAISRIHRIRGLIRHLRGVAAELLAREQAWIADSSIVSRQS